MKERPILFSAPMVRAILAGEKTQTRRAVTKLPKCSDDASRIEWCQWSGLWCAHGGPRDACRCKGGVRCPYGLPGDRLWVRETHAQFAVGEGDRPVPQCVVYRATCREDGSFDYVGGDGSIMGLTVTKWTPAIHMPRWASRITLEITDVRVEQLQTISTLEAMAEGADPRPTATGDPSYTHGFHVLWDSINGERPGCSWDANPWVWALTFRRIEAQP